MSAIHGPTANDPSRVARLTKLFHAVNHGERSLKSKQDANRYIEAVCCQPDPAACVDSLISTPTGLQALQTSVRFDVSDAFLNGAVSDLLSYLQHPDLENLLSGTLLRQIVETITKTPILWNALVLSQRRGGLQIPAQVSFAWLLLQLIRLPNPECTPYHQVAQDPK